MLRIRLLCSKVLPFYFFWQCKRPKAPKQTDYPCNYVECSLYMSPLHASRRLCILFPAIEHMHWLHETHVETVICHALLNRVLLWLSYTSSVFLRAVLVSESLLWSLEAACQAIFQSQLYTLMFLHSKHLC